MKLLTYCFHIPNALNLTTRHDFCVENPTTQDLFATNMLLYHSVTLFLLKIQNDLPLDKDLTEDEFTFLLEKTAKLFTYEHLSETIRTLCSFIKKETDRNDPSLTLLLCRESDQREADYLETKLEKACCGRKLETLITPSGIMFKAFVNWGH